MKHNNFIEHKDRARFDFGKFRLDYFLMILVFIGVSLTCVMLQVVMSHNIEQAQMLLDSKRQTNAIPTVRKGVEWSFVLRTYVDKFPEFVRLKQIDIQGGDIRTLKLSLMTQSVWNAERVRKGLESFHICENVFLKNINALDEDGFLFDLECRII